MQAARIQIEAARIQIEAARIQMQAARIQIGPGKGDTHRFGDTMCVTFSGFDGGQLKAPRVFS